MSNIRARQILYVILGTLCLVIGAIGIFVPLLPTTPLWLLACWFYLRGSLSIYNRVIENRYVGSYLKSYMEDKAIPRSSKFVSIGVMWSSFILSAIFLDMSWWFKGPLALISIAVTIHILYFPTKKKKRD